MILQKTFVHGVGIGLKTERGLWRAGARTWSSYLTQRDSGDWTGSRYDALERTVESSQVALDRDNVTFFSKRLPSSERWRLYSAFSHRAAYVDIETTGLYSQWHDITVIALYDGERTQTFVKGKNLQDFPSVLSRYSLLVTFNGASFDVPFLRAKFRSIRIPPAHIDLRFSCARAGLVGGLKAIEQKVGIKRPAHLRDIDGFEAVHLWRRYQNGERAALETLVEYSIQDVKSLRPLAEIACRKLVLGAASTPRS